MPKQYPAIDVMKFLAAIGIIVLHCELPYISAITRIGLYFFFIASAYFVFSKYHQETTVQKQKKTITGFLWHIGRLYIVWSLLYFPLNLYEMQLRGEDVMYGLLNYVRNFFLTGSYWQLWFLNGLWVSVFLTAVGIRAKMPFKWLFVLALFPYTIGLGYFNYNWLYQIFLADNVLLNTLLAGLNFIWGSPINGLCLGFLFVVIGSYIGLKQPKHSASTLWWGTIISIAGVFGEQILIDYFYPNVVQAVYVFMPLCEYFLLLLLLSWDIKSHWIYGHLRKLSMYLFYLHTWLICIYGLWFNTGNNLHKFVFVFLTTLLASELLIWLSHRIKILKYLT